MKPNGERLAPSAAAARPKRARPEKDGFLMPVVHILDPDNGQELKPVKAAEFAGGKWLLSLVVPLAFRRRSQPGGARTEVRRSDGVPGAWIV